MGNLVDWQGKTEDISIEYEVGFSKQILLEDKAGMAKQLPAMKYDLSDNIVDVTESEWSEEVAKADRIDYLLAVASGSIAGIIDILFVGDFSIERANEWGEEQVNRFVVQIAKMSGCKANDLAGAIRFLEERYPITADKATPEFGGGLQHHLRDFSHHFSLVGLFCSIYTQFTGFVLGTDGEGNLIRVAVESADCIGKDFPEQILFGVVTWIFHLVSDMAGSNSTAGKGTGIPGPLLSFIKELSALPIFKDASIDDTKFRTWISKLFNGTLLAKRDENGKILEPVRFDLRAEIGILHEISRQFVPVMINECLVRGLYFARRFSLAVSAHCVSSIKGLKAIAPEEYLPFNNRVIARMLTVASGTFTAIDAADAAVHAVLKNGGITPQAVKDFAVRINAVGIGRFIVACRTDWSYISEDAQKARMVRLNEEEQYAKRLADLNVLSLNFEQMRILNSIEKKIVFDDISHTRDNKEREHKTSWLNQWKKITLESLWFSKEQEEAYYLDDSELRVAINNADDVAGIYLIGMEAALFRPYFSLSAFTDEKEKKLPFRRDYMKYQFADAQSVVGKSEIENIRSEFKNAAAEISGSKDIMTAGIVGTVVLTVASGGLAMAFAPAIASGLVGSAGLYGAALANYSLAALGGGALAAGGLGVAGGTAIITGGGALIGILGGTGASTLSTLAVLSDKGYILNECSKLVTYCKAVLIDRFKDKEKVKEISDMMDQIIERSEMEISAVSDQEHLTKDQEKFLKTAKKGLKYLQNTRKALQRLLM